MSTLFWGYLSRASGIASSLIIMPIALAKFSAEEFSLWMIFVVCYGMIALFDFGLSFAFSRQINYILSGGQSVEKEGVSKVLDKNNINFNLFSQVLDSCRWVFNILCFLVSIFLVLLYYIYLSPIADNSSIYISKEWLLYSCAIIISIYSLYYNAIFMGTNNVTSLYRVSCVSNASFFVISIPLIFLDFGLMGVVIGRIVSAFSYLIMSKIEIKYNRILAKYVKSTVEQKLALLKTIMPNALRHGCASFGDFMSTKFIVLLIAAYLPLSESGVYSFAVNLLGTITSISILYFTINTPIMTGKVQSNEKYSMGKMHTKIRFVCLSMTFVMCAVLTVIGPMILNVLDSKTALPETALLMIMALSALLDVNRQLSLGYIMMHNTVPFTKAVLTSGLLIVLFVFILFESGFISIWVPIVIYLIVLSLFNNWYWPYREYKMRKLVLAG